MRPILYLAPLQGLTDAIYRNTFTKHFGGFDVAITPFISTVKGNRIKPSHLKDVLPENNSGMPIVPQIMGNEQDDFILLASMLYDLGYKNINWNLGCPYPMVTKKKRGSGLLPYPDLIETFLDKTLSAIPNRLSIKTRLGYKDAEEIYKLIPIFNRYPLTEIIIHPRIGKQMYEGTTDLDTFQECLVLSEHPVVYNGDINSLAVFMDLSSRFGKVNRWMTGRGTLANPFLPAIIKTGRDYFSNKIIKIRKFHDELFARYHQILFDSHLVERMKGFWFYFSKSFKDSRDTLKKIHKVKRVDRYLEVVNRLFDIETDRY